MSPTVAPNTDLRAAVLRESPFGPGRVAPARDPSGNAAQAIAEYQAVADAIEAAGLELSACGPEETNLGSAWPGDFLVPLGRRLLLIARLSSLHDPHVLARIVTRAGCARTLELMPEGVYLSGADMLDVNGRLVVGRRSRLDLAAADYLAGLADREGFGLEIVELRRDAALREVASVLPDGSLLYAAGSLPREALPGVDRVFAAEAVGASVIAGSRGVVLAEEARVTARMLEGRGFPVLTVPTEHLFGPKGGLARVAGRF
jgi:N-dimethylarginine dimethylaminohydrolase